MGMVYDRARLSVAELLPQARLSSLPNQPTVIVACVDVSFSVDRREVEVARGDRSRLAELIATRLRGAADDVLIRAGLLEPGASE
jgi:hypothetical protein